MSKLKNGEEDFSDIYLCKMSHKLASLNTFFSY